MCCVVYYKLTFKGIRLVSDALMGSQSWYLDELKFEIITAYCAGQPCKLIHSSCICIQFQGTQEDHNKITMKLTVDYYYYTLLWLVIWLKKIHDIIITNKFVGY